MKKDFAIIGASYLQLPLILKAKEMGYITHVFAWHCNDVGEKAADYFYPISIVEKDLILQKCREIGICGICSIASDLAAITVNYIAEHMNLTGNDAESTRRSTNKHLMRQTFAANGDPSPKSVKVDENSDLTAIDFAYPVIVKPTDRSGSRGIYKVEKEADLRGAIQMAVRESFEKCALVEEFAEGEEYSVEGISFHGEHHILAITKKYTTGAPHFIETGHKQPAALSPEMTELVKKTVLHALDSLGIKNSASHSEIKISEEGVIRIIEIGGRMGGDCIGSDMVLYSTGIDYLRAVIQVACGEAPELAPGCESFPVEVRYIFNQQDVEELEKMQKTERFVRLVSYQPENIGITTDSSNRAGCYIVKA